MWDGVIGLTRRRLQPFGVLVMAGNKGTVGDLSSRRGNADDKMNGIPILSLAVVAGDGALVDLLPERGADSVLASNDGATRSMLAISFGRSELDRRLGGIPEPTPADDFITAVSDGDVDSVMRLPAEGADPNQGADKEIPVIVIASGNSLSDVSDLEPASSGGTICPFHFFRTAVCKDHRKARRLRGHGPSFLARPPPSRQTELPEPGICT